MAEDSERLLQESAFFRKFIAKGHFARGAGPGKLQGTYIVTPDGELLANSISLEAAEVLPVVRKALEQWRARPHAPVAEREAESKTIAAQQALYPGDGLVLRVYGRELARDAEGKLATQRSWWNLDYAWFRKDEAAQLLPAKLEPGASTEAPQFVMRLARLNLLDVVKGFQAGMHFGQEPIFREAEVDKARLVSRVERVEGQQVFLALEGETHAVTRRSKPERGVAMRLVGQAVYDTGTGRFTRFELGAVGDRWGPTGTGWMNDRKGDPARSPIGFWLEPAGESPAEHMAPVFLSRYGWK